jgi:hypothetical protein
MLFRGQGKGLAVAAVLLGMSVSAKAGDTLYASLGDTNVHRSAGSNSAPKIPASAAVARRNPATS